MMQGKKIVICSSALCCSILLVGCQLATPFGTFTMSFDSNAKSEGFAIINEDGSRQEINTQDLNSQIDNMIDSVSLPQGSSTEDLKQFVNGTSESLGIKEDIQEAQGTLNDMQEVFQYADPTNEVDDLDISSVVDETSAFAENNSEAEQTEGAVEETVTVDQTEAVPEGESLPENNDN